MKRRTFVKLTGAAGAALAAGGLSPQAAQAQEGVGDIANPSAMRVVAWNVACGQWCTPEQVADALKARFDGEAPDIVTLNEVPKFNQGDDAPDWSGEVARLLALSHVYVGSVSSANHRAPDWGDVTGHYGGKFKSILSRWPISNTHDYTLAGEGWSPASAVRAEVRVGEVRWAVYSLHIPGHRDYDKSKHKALAEDVLAHEPLEHVLVTGDFNVRTDSAVLASLKDSAGLTNAITDRAIDHILYKSAAEVGVSAAGIDNGPAIDTRTGGLSDHPYAWAALSLG
ncbi:MAG: endonuclease/exonuclease/phosphatase family protein [Planctomycetota bacterium]